MVKSAFKTTTFWYKFKWNLNSYSQTLTLLFITYTIYPSNVPLLFCWRQLRSLWATLQYQCDRFLQPHRAECPYKTRKEKQWESIVMYKPHLTLTLLLITYTIYPSNVPLLFCWHQLRSLWATLQHQCDHLLQPHRVECSSKYRKEKQWESIVIYKPHFLFLNDHPKDIWFNLLERRPHSATNLNDILTRTLRLWLYSL